MSAPGGPPQPPNQPRKWVQPKVVGGMVVRPAPGEMVAGGEDRPAKRRGRETPTIVSPDEPRRGFWAWVPRAERMLGEDPGSKAWERASLAIIIVLLPLVIFMQQYSLGLRNQTLATAPLAVRNSEEITEPGITSLTLNAKQSVKILHFFHSFAAKAGVDRQDRDIEHDPDFQEELKNIEAQAVTRTDRVRMAMVVGEILGKAAALQRLDVIGKELEPGGGLAMDVDWLRKIYKKGPDSVPEDVRQSLILRHGWFGQLATTFGGHDGDPVRWSAVGGGGKIIGVFTVYGLVMVLIGIAGLIAFIVVIAKRLKGDLEYRFDQPERGGSVYLETYMIFLGGFLLLLMIDLLTFGLGVEASSGSLAVSEVLAWSLVLTPLWPVVRGVGFKQAMADMGWHRGAGIGTEIMCGVAGFLAGRMLFWIGGFVAGLIEVLMGDSGSDKAPGGYPMYESHGSTWTLLILGTMSLVIWAPVVEETIMRGALYRHLRSRWRILWSVLLTAALFGIVHPYSTSGLVAVGFGGVAFALMREWRGSLIAPVIAHALHNGAIGLGDVLAVTAIN